MKQRYNGFARWLISLKQSTTLQSPPSKSRTNSFHSSKPDEVDWRSGAPLNRSQLDASKNPGRIGDGLIHFVRVEDGGWNGCATGLF
jgi:hypothetical protein